MKQSTSLLVNYYSACWHLIVCLRFRSGCDRKGAASQQDHYKDEDLGPEAVVSVRDRLQYLVSSLARCTSPVIDCMYSSSCVVYIGIFDFPLPQERGPGWICPFSLTTTVFFRALT
jgi:hypothetical protein